MPDLRSRLQELDRLPVPDLWPEVERRAWWAAPAPLAGRTRWAGTDRPGRSSMLTPVRVVTAGALVALLTGSLVTAVVLRAPLSSPAGTGAGGSPSAGPTTSATAGGPIDWDTGCVRLIADSLRIHQGSQTFTVAEPVALNSDPGSETYRTLEATWFEGGAEMRMNLYLAADADSWWVKELRTYDGQPRPDWITYRGPLFETPLGESFQGDVLLTGGEGVGPGSLEIRSLRLSVPDFGPGSGSATCMGRSATNATVEVDVSRPGDADAPVRSPSPGAMAPGTAAALEAVSAELLDGCLTVEEAQALLSDALIAAGEQGFEIRTGGPVGGPSDRIDEIMAHVDAGCAIFGGTGSTAEGTRIFYVGGGTGQPTSTFVTGPAPSASAG